MIKKAYQEINISKTDGNIKNFAGQFIGLNYHKWTNKDTILLVTRFTEFKDFENPDEDPTAVDMTGILSLRLAADTELAADATSLFTIDTFNNGDDPAFEDLAQGLVTHKIVLNRAELDTHLGTNKSVTFVLQYSGQDADGNAFTIPDGGITITLYPGVDQDDAPNDPEPPNTYLTTNEIIQLIGGVADITELTAIPEASLLNRQKLFVESEESDYWYDQDAGTGDHAPDDQTASTGFWKKVNTTAIIDNLDATTDPTVNDDSDDGYSRGSFWINNTSSPKEAFRCLDATVGAAVWVKTTLSTDELAAVALSGDKADIGLGNVNNTADTDKPVSTAQQTALDAKADNTTVTEIDGNVNDLVTLSGVAENATDLGTFTGSTITDNSDIKTALQELETEVENGGVASGGFGANYETEATAATLAAADYGSTADQTHKWTGSSGGLTHHDSDNLTAGDYVFILNATTSPLKVDFDNASDAFIATALDEDYIDPGQVKRYEYLGSNEWRIG